MYKTKRSWAIFVFGIALVVFALLFGGTLVSEAKSWPVPAGSKIVSVKVTKKHHKKITTIKYKKRLYYQTTADDLVGSIKCTAHSRVVVTDVPSDILVEADAMSTDSNLVTIDGVSVQYSGICETTNVYIPNSYQLSEGFQFPATWISEEIKPVGATFVPWDVDRMTLPKVPYYSPVMTMTIKKNQNK